MPTIDEAVQRNQDRLAKRGESEIDPRLVNESPAPTVLRQVESPPSVRSAYPSRGSFPTGMVLDTDLDSDIDGIRFRSRLLRAQSTGRSVNVSPASTVANAQVVKVPEGTPLQVTNLTATEIPTKLNGQLVALVTLTWTPGVADTFYSYAQAWVTGYHGITGAQLVASGPSPLTFSLDATNETVTFTVVAVSASGLKASTTDAPKKAVVLSPTSGALPAPTVTQTLTRLTGGGYQFTFTLLSGLLGNIVQSYNVYRNTTNSFSSATLRRTVPQPQTNTGLYVFQDDIGETGISTYYYFVTAVDVNGGQSVATDAQTGAVVTVPGMPTPPAVSAAATTSLTQSGTTTTINIAAGTFYAGSITMNFNSGSVNPGAYGTYYVYFDDPIYAGGAETFFATTDILVTTQNIGRFLCGKITTVGGGGGSGGGSGGGCCEVGTEVVALGGVLWGHEAPCSEWCVLTLANERSLTCVPDHPVYTDRGKTQVCDLRVGEEVVTRDGMVRVRSVVHESRPSKKLVAVVTPGHLYFANSILSHNIKIL